MGAQLKARPTCRPMQRRAAQQVVAHAGHGEAGHAHDAAPDAGSSGAHSHGPSSSTRGGGGGCCGGHGHAHSHAHGHGHAHSHAGLPGHEHEEHCNMANPVHRVLKSVYDATRLSELAEWLEQSTASTAGKVAGIVVAALAAWAASSLAGTAQLAAAAAAAAVSKWATVAVYALAGVPAMVDLSYDLTAGRVDTHVLMTLAALGTLLSGYAIEVGPGACVGGGPAAAAAGWRRGRGRRGSPSPAQPSPVSQALSVVAQFTPQPSFATCCQQGISGVAQF